MILRLYTGQPIKHLLLNANISSLCFHEPNFKEIENSLRIPHLEHKFFILFGLFRMVLEDVVEYCSVSK